MGSSAVSNQIYSIFKLDTSRVSDAKKFAFAEVDPATFDYDQMMAAFSLDKVQELGAVAPLKLNFVVFRSGFVREQAAPANSNLPRKHVELTGHGAESIFNSWQHGRRRGTAGLAPTCLT